MSNNHAASSKSMNRRTQQQAQYHLGPQQQHSAPGMAAQGANQGPNPNAGQYPNEQDNLKSYIQDLKKAAVGNKKGRGNGSQSRGGPGAGAPAQLAATGQNQSAYHHPQTTKNQNSNPSLGLINSNFASADQHHQPQQSQSQSFNNIMHQQQQMQQLQNMQNLQIHNGQKRNVNTSKSQGGVGGAQNNAGAAMEGQMQRSQSRGGSRANYANNGGSQQIVFQNQGANGQVTQSQNYSQGMMAPLINQAPGAAPNQPPRNQSRQQSRQSYQSYGGSQTATKEKTSQLLKNYENIIRKEKQGGPNVQNSNNQNNFVSQNNQLLKRINANQSSASNTNKSLHNEKSRGQRSQSNLRKSHGLAAQQNMQNMNLSQQKFYNGSNPQMQFSSGPQTAKNATSNGMSAQSGLQRAIKNLNSDSRNSQTKNQDDSGTNRGQKDVIIRKNSSKQFVRPSSSTRGSAKHDDSVNLKKKGSGAVTSGSSTGGGHYRNKTQVVKKNILQNNQIVTQNGQAVNTSGMDSSLMNLNNSSFTQVNSPQNRGDSGNVIMLYNQGSGGTNSNSKNPMIMTDSTHANSHSDAAPGSHSLAQKRLRSQQNYIGNMNTQAALNALAANQITQQQQLHQNTSVGSGGPPNQMIDEGQRRDMLLKNAKSLGNSLGTANKKTLNMSQHGNPGLGMAGIEREQSTLNDGQFFTLAKTGLLNNLNLSQLIRSQGILEEDGIEDMHFYFVSFNNHKSKILQNQEKKYKKQKEQQKSKSQGAKKANNKKDNDSTDQVKTIESMSNKDEVDWNDN